MKTFFDNMAQVVKGIQADPNLVLLSHHVPEPVSQSTIAAVETKLGITLDADWKSFFRAANGYQLRWGDKKDKYFNPKIAGGPHTGPFDVERVDMDEELMTGCVNILPLEDIFLNKPSYVFGYDPELDMEEGLFAGRLLPWRKFAEKLHPFDIFGALRNVAVFVESNELILVRGTHRNSHAGSVFCDLRAYLDLVVSTKGSITRAKSFKTYEEEPVLMVRGSF